MGLRASSQVVRLYSPVGLLRLVSSLKRPEAHASYCGALRLSPRKLLRGLASYCGALRLVSQAVRSLQACCMVGCRSSMRYPGTHSPLMVLWLPVSGRRESTANCGFLRSDGPSGNHGLPQDDHERHGYDAQDGGQADDLSPFIRIFMKHLSKHRSQCPHRGGGSY